jgi:Ca2+-binding EF-hand superfamily protein
MVIVTILPLVIIALLPLFAMFVKFRDDRNFKKKYEDMSESMQLPENLVTKVSAAELKSLRKCFVYFDKDGGGSFTLEELVATMRELRLNPHEDEVKQLVEEADVNGDGEVSFEEFAAVMM